MFRVEVFSVSPHIPVNLELLYSESRLRFDIAADPLARGIFIRIRCFLQRPRLFGHMPKVHSNPCPGRRTAAHRIDEHIVDGKKRGSFRVFPLPPLQAGKRCFLIRRVRDDQQRRFCARRLRRRFLHCRTHTRRSDTRRFAFHFTKVRRPGRIAQTFCLISRREFQQPFQRARFSVNPGVWITDLSESLRDRENVEVGRITVRNLVPAKRHGDSSVRQRPHRIGRARCAILRVLVVVEEHAVAFLLPPFELARAGARRSISRDKVRAARRTSTNVQRCSIRTLTCMPREPLVFGQPRSPISSRNALTSSATRRTSSQTTPGPGSR